MATFTIYADPADATVSASSETYADARAGVGATVVADAATLVVGQALSGGVSAVHQALLSFDTTVIPDDAGIGSATVSLWLAVDDSTTNFDLWAVTNDWGVAADAGDFQPGASINPAGASAVASIATGSLGATGAYETLVSQSTLRTSISPTGVLRLGLVSRRQVDNQAPSGTERVEFSSADVAGTTQDPRLVVVTGPEYLGICSYVYSKTTDTTLASSNVVAGWVAGDLLVVLFAMDPATGTVSIADAGSSTWTLDRDVTNGSGTSGVRLCVFSAIAATDVAQSTANAIVVTHPSCQARAAIAAKVGISSVVVDAVGSGTGASTTPSVSATATGAEGVAVAAVAAEAANFAITDDPTWGEIVQVGTTGGGAASNIVICAQFQPVSGAGAMTCAMTIDASRTWAAGMMIYAGPPATARHAFGHLGEAADGYHMSLDHDGAGAVTQAVFEPITQPGATTGRFEVVLAGGTVRSLVATPPGGDVGGQVYLSLVGDGVTVTDSGTDDADVTGIEEVRASIPA